MATRPHRRRPEHDDASSEETQSNSYDMRILFYNYFPHLGDPLDPAYVAMLKEAEALKDNPLTHLVAALGDVQKSAEVRWDNERTNRLAKQLGGLRAQHETIRSEMRKRLLRQLSDPILEKFEFDNELVTKERPTLTNFMVDIRDDSDADAILSTVCGPDNPTYAQISEQTELWESSDLSRNPDKPLYIFSSPLLPTTIDGLSLQIQKSFHGESFVFIPTPEMAQRIVKAPLVEIPELAPMAA